MAEIVWTGVKTVLANVEAYGDKVRDTVVAIAEYMAPQLESFAKENAPWTDRTGNARQSLKAWVDDTARDVVWLYLAHGMEYGVFLELRYASRFAILWPTIQAHIPQITAMLKGAFG